MPPIHELKPRLLALLRPLLRPLVRRLHAAGVTANEVTVAACLVSVALGLGLFFAPSSRLAFAWIPLWTLLCLATGVVVDMLVREHGQHSRLGAMLDELGDVLAEAALFLPFAAVEPFEPFWVGALVVGAVTSEFAGALGPTIGASRRHDGPLGKRERAVLLGMMGLAVACTAALPAWSAALMPLATVLVAWTIANRVRRALAEGASAMTGRPLR